MGFGSSGHARLPLSSNLSPLAPPFTVGRSTSKPFSGPCVNLTEPPFLSPPICSDYNRIPYSCTPTDAHDFFANPVSDAAAEATTDVFLFGQCSNGIETPYHEAKPHHAFHISPPVYDNQLGYAWSTSLFSTLDGSSQNDYAKESSGLEGGGKWGTEWNQENNPVLELGRSSCSKENNIASSLFYENLLNQGSEYFKALNNEKGVPHSLSALGREKHSIPSNEELLDDTLCFVKNFEPMCGDKVYHSLFSNSYSAMPSNLAASAGNDQLSYSSSYDTPWTQHDNSCSVGRGLLMTNASPLEGFNASNETSDKDLDGNNFANMNEPKPLPSSEEAGCSHSGQLILHLKQKNPASSSKTADLLNRSIIADALDPIFNAKPGIKAPQISPIVYNLGMNNEGAVNCIEKSFNCMDQQNPAVDSPCWKGTPNHFSSFENFDPVNKHDEKKYQGHEHGRFNLQEPQNFLFNTEGTVTKSSEHSTKNVGCHKFQCVENLMETSPSLIKNGEFKEHNSDNAVKNDPQTKPNSGYGVRNADDICEAMEICASPPQKSIRDCHFRPFSTMQEIAEENELLSEKEHISGPGGSTDAGFIFSDLLKICAPHAKENIMSSSVSEDMPSRLSKSTGEESCLKNNLQILIKSMHNLSELLLSQCLESRRELKEQDSNVLKSVVNNLDLCLLKNTKHMIQTRESLNLHRESSLFDGQFPKIQQNWRSPNEIKVEPFLRVELENPEFQKGKNCNSVSSMQLHHEKFAESSMRTDAEMMKKDCMTKALKKVLSQNFHNEGAAESQTLLYRNLWLEAEAELCSLGYIARYNRLKMEMENCSSRAGESTMDTQMPPMPEDFHNSMKVDRSETKVTSVLSPHPNIQESSISNASQHSNDILTRFYVLKNRPNNSSMNSADVDKMSNSEFSPGLSNARTAAEGGKGRHSSDIFIQDSPVSVTSNKQDDFEVSVLARFHVLKSREENSSSACSEGKLLDKIGTTGSKPDCSIVKNRTEEESLDVQVDSIKAHHRSCSENKPTWRDFDLNEEEDQDIQFHPTNGHDYKHPITSYSDGSDWEHL